MTSLRYFTYINHSSEWSQITFSNVWWLHCTKNSYMDMWGVILLIRSETSENNEIELSCFASSCICLSEPKASSGFIMGKFGMESVCMQYCIVASFRSTTEERLGTNWMRKFKKGKNKDNSNVCVKNNIHKCTRLKSNLYLDAYIYVMDILLGYSSFYLFILPTICVWVDSIAQKQL